MAVMRIAVVVPAYQAETTIQDVILSVPDYVDHIIVVNDASTDCTEDMVRQLTSTSSQIVLINHSQNTGVGDAVFDGYQEACRLGSEIVVKIDSDGQMDPHKISALIAPIQAGQADYTKGNRFLHATQLRAMPLVRRLGNIGLSFLTKLSSGYWNIFDPTNGYTAIHASLIPLLREEKIHKRYFFESSMLIELGVIRAVVKDVYIPARYGSEKSSLSELDSLMRFPWLLLKGAASRILVQYFVRDFTAVSLFLLVSLPLILFGLTFGVVHWIESIQTQVPATTGTVMVATVPFILGVQFLLQCIAMDVQNVPEKPVHVERVEDEC